jgi:alkanesulfonate monooxygenase SsuD/methylene tetrahydromethanopterin reductase-like flavin-dependent oxidoreductase (luciferase family)
VHAGAREAGRTPDDVEIWFTARSSLHDDRATAIDGVKASVSSILNHAMRYGLDGKNVPDDLRGKIQTYLDNYVLYDHVLQGGENPRRMEALGLTQYALDRWALAGNASDWIARIEEVAQAGATRLWIGLSGHDLEEQKRYLRVLGEQIMRRFA